MSGRLGVSLVSGLVLIGNFFALMRYGDAFQSTHLFIVRSTVFYPLARLSKLYLLATGIELSPTDLRKKAKAICTTTLASICLGVTFTRCLMITMKPGVGTLTGVYPQKTSFSNWVWGSLPRLWMKRLTSEVDPHI